MIEHWIKEVQQSFQEQFDEDPLMIFSPGRINLIGEHTDYNDGFAFPAAIDKGIAIAMKKSNSGSSKVFAFNKSEGHEFNTGSVKPLLNGGWRNYILGVVGELKLLGKNIGEFNSVFAGNIPGGAGMSSSAALENGFVYGLNQLFDLGLSKNEMILVSQRAEHNYAGVKCGIMDQYASMFGIDHSALLLDCRTVQSETYTIDLGDYKLMLINTNVKHDLSESAYNDRRAACEKVAAKMGVKALRDAKEEDLIKIKKDLSVSDFEKALYVIRENDRVVKFAKAISNNTIEELGQLLFDSHKGLSENYQVSCEELDFLVQMAHDADSVMGARMMGGGFGGCTINLVSKDGYDRFKQEVSTQFRKKFLRDCSIYDVKLAQGTRIIEL